MDDEHGDTKRHGAQDRIALGILHGVGWSLSQARSSSTLAWCSS